MRRLRANGLVSHSKRRTGIIWAWNGASENILDIEDGVAGVHGSLVLGGLTDQPLLLVEGNERRGGEATLLVGNDLDIAALVGSDTGVGGTCQEKASVSEVLDRRGAG